MSNPSESSSAQAAPLDLSAWRKVPNLFIGVGGALAVLGLLLDSRQFAYSWLTGYMFVLSFVLGGFFLVLMHHLFDASWSVPIRRVCEHIASLSAPWMAVLFLPIAIFAKPILYQWMTADPHADHAVQAKYPLFTVAGFYLVAFFCFLVWWSFSNRLRYWSLKQDQAASARGASQPGFFAQLLGLNQNDPGSVECTAQMRKFAAAGIFLFAVTLTLAAIMWMKALQYQWFSTMYGVYYFAGCVWTALATVYLITAVLQRHGSLKDVVHSDTYYYLGSLLLAFTVFYAYIHFSQYFIIWNANVPEETFWYKDREEGSWWDIGQVIIFGHFFVPFLALLRIDAKLSLTIMVPICCWAWLMHFVDISFNVLPVSNPEEFPAGWIWLPVACSALMIGALIKVFLKQFLAHPPYPVKDPRLAESLNVYVPPASAPGAAGGAK